MSKEVCISSDGTKLASFCSPFSRPDIFLIQDSQDSWIKILDPRFLLDSLSVLSMLTTVGRRLKKKALNATKIEPRRLLRIHSSKPNHDSFSLKFIR